MAPTVFWDAAYDWLGTALNRADLTSASPSSAERCRHPADDRDQPPGQPLRRQPALLMITFRAFCWAASANVSYAPRNWSKVKR